MLIVTGSQGERRAASAQLSRGRYLGIELKEGDSFLFSSRTIPGNERGVIRIHEPVLSESGVDLFDADDGVYHVSGHANRPDLEAVHDLLKPRMIMIPMHGEHMHLREHAKLAEKGIASAVATNGTMLDLSGDTPRVVDHIDTGRIYLDGSVLIGAMDGVVRDRIRMALNGHAMVSGHHRRGRQPAARCLGRTVGPARKGPLRRAAGRQYRAELAEFLERADAKTVADDDKLEEAMRKITRQVAMEEIGKKPEVTVVISRLAP
jgi:ribonuclease J